MENFGDMEKNSGFRSKLRNLFRRSETRGVQEPIVAEPEAQKISDEEVGNVTKKFFMAMSEDEDNSFWTEHGDIVEEIFNNPHFESYARDILTTIASSLKKIDEGGERGQLDVGKYGWVTTMMTRGKEGVGRLIDKELASDRPGMRVAIEATVGIADLDLAFGARRELYGCLEGKVPQAYERLMSSIYEEGDWVREDPLTAARLLGLALKAGTEGEAGYATDKVTELVFDRGQVSHDDETAAEVLLDRGEIGLNNMVGEKIRGFVGAMGMEYSRLGNVWESVGIGQVESSALSRLANIRVMAEIARDSQQRLKQLYEEDGVRIFSRFSPEEWKMMNDERDNVDADWVLVVGARSDREGIYTATRERSTGEGEMIKRLKQLGVAVRYVEAGSVEEVQMRLDNLNNRGYKKAKGMVLMSHGDKDGRAILGNSAVAEELGENFTLEALDVLTGSVDVLKELIVENGPCFMDMCYGGKSLTEPMEEMGIKAVGSKYSIRGGEITPTLLSDGSLSLSCVTQEITPKGPKMVTFKI